MTFQVSSTEDAKNQIMNYVLRPASYLANYLGYGWCGGCGPGISNYVGEGFYRTADGWQATYTKGDKSCDGYKSEQRLGIAFSNWQFGFVTVNYGQVTQDANSLTPQTIDNVQFDNYNSSLPTSSTLNKSYQSSSTTINTFTTSLTVTDKISETIKLSFPGIGEESTSFELSVASSFSAGQTQSQTSQETLSITENVNVPAYTRIPYSIIMNSTKSSVNYTALMQVSFTLEFKGFLRWGGDTGPNSNYYRGYEHSGKRPTINYTFGNSQMSFADDLKNQSANNIAPWDWASMLRDHPDAQGAINALIDPSVYTFNITGRLDNVRGTSLAIVAGTPQTNPSPPSNSRIALQPELH